MLKSIIVDDELKSRESLKKLLTNFCGHTIDVCATCQNVNEALVAIDKYKPDVVFLDVQMQGESGFDLLEKLTVIDFEVIFTTAHSEFALRAIKFSPSDYLLKPVNIEELQNAIIRVKGKQDKSSGQKFKELHYNLRQDSTYIRKLVLPTSEGLTFISINDIVYLKASGNYTELFLSTGDKYLVSRQLKEYDLILAENNFFRIHHSFLINLNEVKNYIKGDGGYVVMSNKAVIDVSRRRKEGFLQRIGYRSGE